jgi:hypothetical protein
MATKKTVLVERLAFWKEVYEKYQHAYLALIEGKVQSYTIDDRTITRFQLGDLMKYMQEVETKIDELEAAIGGQKSRKAFAIVPRDW